jgi:hypothetical protein
LPGLELFGHNSRRNGGAFSSIDQVEVSPRLVDRRFTSGAFGAAAALRSLPEWRWVNQLTDCCRCLFWAHLAGLKLGRDPQ